jgi:hypothetical protein
MDSIKRMAFPVLVGSLLAGCLSLFTPEHGPQVSKRAPVTEGSDAEGKALSLGNYQGKVVLLNFWHAG